MVMTPVYMFNGFTNEKLDKVNIEMLKKVFGGFGIYYLVVHYMIYQFYLSYKIELLVQSELISVRGCMLIGRAWFR